MYKYMTIVDGHIMATQQTQRQALKMFKEFTKLKPNSTITVESSNGYIIMRKLSNESIRTTSIMQR